MNLGPGLKPNDLGAALQRAKEGAEKAVAANGQ